MIELVVSILVLSILLAIAIPSFNNLAEKYRLKGAAERLSADVQFAKSEAVSRNTPVNLVVAGGADWCIGVSDSGDCDCSTDGDCQVDGQNHAISGGDFAGVQMEDADVSIQFAGVRGLPDMADSQTFEFENEPGKQLQLVVTRLGSVRLCSPSGTHHLSGYEDCPEED